MAIIKTSNLTKKFKDLVAVDRVDLEIEEGECFGLLGPNGSGKTTLIRMITAVSPPTGGDVFVLGKDLKSHSRETKAVLGVVPQIDNLDDDLTVFQNLTTFSRYFAVTGEEASRRGLEALKVFQLEEKKNSRIKELSGGMKRRLLLARGLLNNPQVLILDEPTVGLDPQAKHLVWRKLVELKSQGVTLLLCTQNMEEAAALCDRVAIMSYGKIITLDSPEALVTRYVGEEVLEIEVDYEGKAKIINEFTIQQIEFVDAGHIIQIFHRDRDEIAGIMTDLPGKLRQRAATLEDVFFGLTGRTLIE